MFTHIPENYLSTQINGNVKEALRVLNVSFTSIENRSPSYEQDFFTGDPDNPITQVSRTPSDEGYPCEWQNEYPGLNDTKLSRMDTKSIDPESTGVSIDEEARSEKEKSENEETTDLALIKEKDEEANNDKDDEANEENDEVNGEKDEANATIPEDFITQANDEKPFELSIKSKKKEEDIIKFIADIKQKLIADGPLGIIYPRNSACIFQLPIVLNSLKEESPLSYINKYSSLDENRKRIYEKKFKEYCFENNTSTIQVKELRKLYEKNYGFFNLKYEMDQMLHLLHIDQSMETDMENFTKISCFFERVLLQFHRNAPPEAFKKHDIEINDFSSFSAKLKNMSLQPDLHNLLKYIINT